MWARLRTDRGGLSRTPTSELCEKLTPKSMHVGVPSAAKALSSLSPKKHKAAGQCLTFVLELVKALVEKRVAVSLHCPESHGA
jgi:hypothetical protein